MTVYDRMDESATHIPALAACIAATDGPVVEFGVGNYSTPILHEMCRGRSLISYESNAEWYRAFANYSVGDHIVRLVQSYDDAILPDHVSVVFIDHAPGERRIVDIRRCVGVADYIVCHDTTDISYGYERVFASFKYRHEYKRYKNATAVVSNTKELSWLSYLA